MFLLHFCLIFLSGRCNKKITLFGSCRLESLSCYNNRIRDEISYTYDTKETLEVIKFLKYNHITSEQSLVTFRTPMLTKIPICYENLEHVLDSTDIFIIEISGKKTYKYKDLYIHSFLKDIDNILITSEIIINRQNDDEIENDILAIIKLLNTQNIIIVSHIVTDEKSERYELSNLLQQICSKYNILFINPVKEITQKGYNIYDLVDASEKKIIHYNRHGNNVIKEIYQEYINKLS